VRARSRCAEQTTAAALVQPLPAGHRVAVIDRALLESDAEGAKTLRESIVSTWTSLEEFDSRGFGFAAMHGSSVVGHSLTSYACGDRCEIGVEIQQAH
jgi:hypothetical protein